MKNTERRFIDQPVEIRAEADGKKKIVGYAAMYNAKSSLIYGMFEEIIAPGAFDGADMSDVRALFNHDPNLVLGRTKSGTLKLSVDERGLRYEIDPPDTQDARDLMVKIARGDISQSSFAFTISEDEWDESAEPIQRRILKFSAVRDISPVTYAAYPDTSSGLRSAEDRNTTGIGLETSSKVLEIIEKRTLAANEEARLEILARTI